MRKQRRKPLHTYTVTLKVERVISVLIDADTDDQARSLAETLDWYDEQVIETLNWTVKDVVL